MTDITSKFSITLSLGDALKKRLDKHPASYAKPLLLINKATILECLELKFSLRAIYEAWMSHYQKPPFNYDTFRRNCIKLKIYTPRKTGNSPEIEAKNVDFAQLNSNQDNETPKENIPDIQPGESEPLVTIQNRPRHRINIIQKPAPIEELPDNSLPPFSNSKTVY